MSTFTITMPLPPPELSPNTRVFWRKKMAAVAHYRALAAMHTRQLKPKDWKQAKAATVKVRFFFSDRRRRDKDNLQASLKAAIDGIVGTRLWNPFTRKYDIENNGVLVDDDQLTWLPIEIDIDPFDQYVSIEIITQENA